MNNKTVSGIYTITNKVSGKIYIGSSVNIHKRWGQHAYNLKHSKHRNKHLQASFNKHGLEAFEFSIVQQVADDSKLIAIEQVYLDEYKDNWGAIYNMAKQAGAGGASVLRVPMFVLNTDGSIYKEFESGADLSRYLGKRITYRGINLPNIFNYKYRLVTQEFYWNNLSEVLGWKDPIAIKKEIKRLEREKKIEDARYKYIVCDVYEFKRFNSYKDASKYIGVSRERVRQVMSKLKPGQHHYFERIGITIVKT